VVDFRLSELEDESDPVLWKTVSIDDDQQLDILLVPNGTLFSSVVRNDEKEITFDYAFVQDIRTALVDGRELIIVHLVYCGAASCSSELVALY
jgi:hypothetical protein